MEEVNDQPVSEMTSVEDAPQILHQRHKYKKIDISPQQQDAPSPTGTLSRNLKDATKRIAKPVYMAGTTTKHLVKGTAGYVKDVASGVYDEVTGSTESAYRKDNGNSSPSSSTNTRISRMRKLMKRTTPDKDDDHLEIDKTDMTRPREASTLKHEKVDEQGDNLQVSLPEVRTIPLKQESSSKTRVSPIKNLTNGINSIMPKKNRLRKCDNRKSDISHQCSDISEATTGSSSVYLDFAMPFRWVNNRAQNGLNRLRRNKIALHDKDAPPVNVPITEAVQICSDNVWNIQMNPTLEFLFHDATIAIVLFASVVSMQTLRNFSLVMQGSIPTAVHISWLLLAFHVGMEIGRVRGMRPLPVIMTKPNGATHHDDIPSEIEIEIQNPAPTREGYILLYQVAAVYHQVRIVFPKDVLDKVVQTTQGQIPTSGLGKLWSTLGDQGSRVRQSWEIVGFVQVTECLMNRLLRNPDIHRAKLKELAITEQATKLAESGQITTNVLGEIRIDAESLDLDVVAPRFRLRGVDVFLTDAAEENMCSHPFLLKQGLRKKPTLLVNGLVQWANICIYFELPDWFTDFDDIIENEDDSPDVKAIKRFLLGDDDYRNARLNILPCLVDGPLPIKALAPPKRELTVSTTSLSSKWNFHKKTLDPDGTVLQPVLEMELDAVSNAAIRGISAMLKRYIKSIALDVAVVIQTPNGQAEQEPEACLGLWRFDHIDVTTCPPLPTRLDQQREDLIWATQFMQHSMVDLAEITEETGSLTLAS